MVHPVKQARLRCSAEQGEVPLYMLPSGLLVFSEITSVSSAEVGSTPVDPQKNGPHTSGSYHFSHPFRSYNNYGCWFSVSLTYGETLFIALQLNP